MNEDKSFVTREDIEGRLADLKTETDGIGGPSIISRRILAVSSAVLILLVVFYVVLPFDLFVLVSYLSLFDILVMRFLFLFRLIL